MSSKKKVFLEIAITLPVKETFSYSVPDNLIDRADVGCRATVPFRNRKVTGYILERGAVGNNRKDLKPVLDILDPKPLFHPGIVPFFKWMADYYLYPIGLLIKSTLPGGLNPSQFKTGRLTEKGLMALELLPDGSDEKRLLDWINRHPGKRLRFPFHLVCALQRKGWLVIEHRTGKRRAGPITRKFVRPRKGKDLESILEKRTTSFRAKQEVEFLDTVFQSKGILLSELTSKFGNGSYLVNKWRKMGLLEYYSAPVLRNPAGKFIFPSPVPEELYEQQKNVLNEIESCLDEKAFSTFLIYGVTGSGKTEVYSRAIERVVRLGRQAILMVPEIALAVYMEGLFRSRFGERIAVFHSGLSEGERYDQWIRMAGGEVDLVIGARSALFAPFPGLGIIIVDEEHDFSYKQEEGFRYQARDAAVVRGKIEKVPVILGSGTPSVQSFHNTVTGRYKLLSMPDRIEKRPMPAIETVDMKTVSEGRGEERILSPVLRKAIERNLEEGKQSILFLNRRGFYRVHLCRKCGESIKCRNCDLALIHHLKENRLACHYCGFHVELENKCPSCGHRGIRAYGFGTERLEQELKEDFPGGRIVRMDRDSARRRGYTFNILKKFGDHEIDILLGTQMITKGYDFPNVTLVGVIAADFSLGFPDFRASERTFQILSQVAGRAGRGDQKGRVIIQTFNPAHYAITSARDHDYQLFYQRENELRKQLGYPPFSYLARLKVQGNNKTITAEMAQRLGKGMAGILAGWPKRGKDIQVLGPVEAPLSRLKGKYRWQILVKSKGSGLLHYFLNKVEGLSGRILRKTGVNMVMDVDPYQML